MIFQECIETGPPSQIAALDELISIEHKFLQFLSGISWVPVHFFGQDYTAIRSFLRLPFLWNIFLKIDYMLAYKII